MRRTLIVLAVTGVLAWVSPALAQTSSSSGGAGGGSASSGSNKSSITIHTTGGSAVGVAQGSVAGGARTSGTNNGGDQQGSASSGGSGAGQSAGALAVPAVAVEDGVVNQVSLPVMDLGETETAAADRRPDAVTWAIAAVIVIGLFVLYRRMPRGSRAA